MHMSYAGDIDPDRAWQVLHDDPDAVLVDVRTEPEWNFVGVPDVRSLDREVVLVEWNRYPGQHNADFVADLRAAGVEEDRTVLFICRSGQRSRDAAIAATRAGISPAWNVSEGFEGPLDADGHRGSSGWRSRGLPWRQS
ncbi:MAG: rhodanese-like domain-containing protein [Propionibacteriaceae bacterium]